MKLRCGGAYQLPAVLLLHQHLVACRQVQNDFRPRKRGCSARRNRHPQILTKFHSQLNSAQNKQLSRSERHSLRGIVHHYQFFSENAGRLEPARLVEFVIAGQVGLWDYTQDLSAAGDDCAVEKPAGIGHRRAQSEQYGKSRCLRNYRCNSIFGAFRKSRATEKVGAGVSCHAKFGEYNYRGLLFLPYSVYQRNGFFCICFCISDVDLRHCGCHPNVSVVFHQALLLWG